MQNNVTARCRICNEQFMLEDLPICEQNLCPACCTCCCESGACGENCAPDCLGA